MKPATLRRRLATMETRLQRDLDALDKLFPCVDYQRADDATEAIRNLATAIVYVRGMSRGMSDYGLEEELKNHATTQPS
jgi:hypothetical protein